MIIGVDHTGFIVTNIEESAHFYQNVIGLKLIDSFERKGSKISQVIGYPDAHLKVNFFELGSSKLELIEYVHPEPDPRPTEEILKICYSNSEVYQYWNRSIFPKSENVRREKIFKVFNKTTLDFIKSKSVIFFWHSRFGCCKFN